MFHLIYFKRILLTGLICISIFLSVSAEVPQVINYQGRLTDDVGTPITGDLQITFKIYYIIDVGGAQTWTEVHPSVTVTDGLFNVFLGSYVTLPDNCFSDDTTSMLGITIGNDPEIIPRTRLITVPYAYQALRADTADYALSIQANAVGANEIATNAVGADEIATSAVGSDEIAPNAVGASEIDNNAVGASEIADGVIYATHIADNAVTQSKIAQNAVTDYEIASNAIGASEIATDAVDSDEIVANAVGSSEIANDAVGASEIAPGAVGASEIAVGAVYGTHIADNAVTQTKIAQNAVTSYEMADNAIDFREITSGAVRTDEIYDGTIQQDDLAFTAVDESSTQTITGTKTFTDLNIGTTTRRISIPQAAFVPNSSTVTYSRNPDFLKNSTTNIYHYYYAPVSLPDGAVVTQLEGIFYDNETTFDGAITLHMITPGGSSTYNIMANASTTGAPGVTTIVDNSIDYATIDNENYNYIIGISMRYSADAYDMRLYGAEIEYTITRPLP